jgi:thioredoxin-related protein
MINRILQTSIIAIFTISLFTSFTLNTNENLEKISTKTTLATEIEWISWNEMVEAQKTEKRKVIIDVYTDWCGWCKHMDKTTFKDESVVKYVTEKFYAVKLDAETKEEFKFQNHTFKYIKQGRKGINELAYSLLDGKLSYPSIVYLNGNFARIVISPGYKDNTAMQKELKYIAEEIYSKKTWADYVSEK